MGETRREAGETAGELDAVNIVNAVPRSAGCRSGGAHVGQGMEHGAGPPAVARGGLGRPTAKCRGCDVARSRRQRRRGGAAAETKYAEKSVSGLYLIQSHGGYDSYGKAVREKIAECIERIEGKMDDETRAKVHKRFEKLGR